MTDLIPVSVDSALSTRLAEYTRQAAGAFAPNTARALRADSAVFAAWCAEHYRQMLPASAETVALFVEAMGATRKLATVRRYVSSIAALHRAAGVEPPTRREPVRLALRRLARAYGSHQKQAAPMTWPVVERLIAEAERSRRLIDLRDIALVSVAYDRGARQSEIVALDVEDLQVDSDGTGTVRIRRSKTDQEGMGIVRWIGADTVRRLTCWLWAAGITSGAIFRSVQSGNVVGDRLTPGDVARRFKRLGVRIGLGPMLSGHSARVGSTQDLIAAGQDLAEIMVDRGWKTATMPARYGARLMAKRGAMAKLAAVQGR